MFPIVNSSNVRLILEILEARGGVFIKDLDIAYTGETTFNVAKKVFNSGIELPSLDNKTMFPNTVKTLPGASRKVIQRYMNRSFDIKPLNDLTRVLSLTTDLLVTNILLEAQVKYQWSDFQLQNLLQKDEWALNIANYPFTKERKGLLLFPAHKDWGLMAIYPYVDGPGLEVYVDDIWKPIELPKDCLFCYAGDIFSKMTKNSMPALLHRVSQPPVDFGDRTSIIFYADPIRTMELPNGKLVGDLIDLRLKKIGQIES